MEGLTAKQRKALDKFREQLGKDADKEEDRHLYKWLKARSFDVRKALAMYRNSKEMKEKMRVHTLIEEFTPPEVIQKYLAGGACGFDKEGSPIGIELFGHLDMRGLMSSARKSDFEKTKLRHCEHLVQLLREKSDELGRTVDNITVIFDMENTGAKNLWKPGLEMYTHLVALLEDNYPEMVKRLFVINAPRIFPILWKIGRPLISEDMKNKISILSSDYQSELLELIDPDQLPACYGGTLTDPDGNPRCPSKICQGGEVPKSYYLSESVAWEDMESVWIQPSRLLKLECDVQTPGAILRWEFQTEDYDIGFRVVRQRAGAGAGAHEDVMPMKRFNCQHVVEDGTLVCDVPGKYTVVFDNTYSWTKWKHLHYVVELHTTDSPHGQDIDTLEGQKVTNTRLTAGVQSTRL